MRGFSLLELLIVILILGIVAAAAFPRLAASLTQAKLDAATSEVLSAVHYARSRAANSGKTWRVVFNVGGDSFRVEKADDPNLSALLNSSNTTLSATVLDVGVTPSYTPAEFPEQPGATYVVNLGSGTNFSGIDIVSATFGGGQTLSFDAKGVPANGGSVTLGCGGVTEVVTLDALSGRTTVQ